MGQITIEGIIDNTLRREGWPQLSNRTADRGGWTKGGITAAAWGEYAKLGRPATPQELNAITEQQARAFYFDRHVAPYQDVPDPIKLLMIDWSVTSWHDDPTKALQIELTKRRLYAGKLDGVFGPKTRAGLEQFLAMADDDERRRLYLAMAKMRIVKHVQLGLNDDDTQQFMDDNDDVQLHNLLGWVNRGLEFFD